MTTDTEGLIERLRELAGQVDPCFVGGRDAKLLLASADEIERLSAEIARLREALFKIHRASQSNRKDKLSRIEEIARNALQGDGR